MHNFESDIQKLMGTLLFVPSGLDKSPYKSLIEPNMWIEVCDDILYLLLSVSTIMVYTSRQMCIILQRS